MSHNQTIRPLFATACTLSLVLLLSALLTACQTTQAVEAPAPSNNVEEVSYAGKKILFVNSYHEGYEWSDGIEAGLQAGLDGTGVEVRLVRMDTKNHADEEFRRTAAQEANSEIEDFQPDIIVTADDNAQSYLVVPFLMDTEYPILFVGVNWDASGYGFPNEHITGMVEIELVAEMIDHLSGYAQGSRVGYLTVDSETERKVAEEYNTRFFDGQLQVYSVSTYEEFTAAFLQAQEEVDMLFMGNNAGIDTWEGAESYFIENTRIPTGSINSWMAPYSLLTLAKNPEEQGEWAAHAALQILDGTPITEIEVAQNKRGDLILNMDIAEVLDIVFAPELVRNAEIYSTESEGAQG